MKKTPNKHYLIYGLPCEALVERLKKEKARSVFVAELRPHLKGAKLLAQQLLKAKIKPVIICDNMLAFCMWRNLVKKVIISYEHVAQDFLMCPTGSLIAAICAHHHEIGVEAYPIQRGWDTASEQEQDLRFMCGKPINVEIKTYVPTKEQVPSHYIKTVHDE